MTRTDVLSESKLRKVIVRPVLNDFFMFPKFEMECWTIMENNICWTDLGPMLSGVLYRKVSPQV